MDTPIIGSLVDSPATASLPTMMPLPGATSLLCAGSSAYLPPSVTTDERGFPMDPNCASGAVDLGAVQTNYTGYITTGYNGAVSQTISPSPTAEVLETNALTGAQDSVGGIPVTLTLVGNGTLSGTATETTAPTTINNVTSNLAVYGGLSINAAGTGDWFTPSIGAYTPTANVTAGTFNIGGASGTQLVFTTPPATPLQEGNAEPVVVSEETAGGAKLTVSGTNFTSQSTVMWGTTALTTTYVSATELTAQVTAPLVATEGTVSVTVVTPAPGGGTSNAYSVEIDTAGSAPPTFTTATVTVTAGAASTANYPVTLASSATNISVTCLNLPAGATCSYSSGALIVNTTASTPAGTYVITAVFTETLSGTASGLILLIPLAGAMRRRKAGMMLAGLVMLGLAAVIASGGCGGGGGGGYTPPPPTTYTTTSSGTVTLVVH